jgi:UDP-glucose 4-epimerase
MKAIVFGGSGFIGSHTADELSSRGFDVIIFDNQPSRYIRDNQQMIIGDILDIDAVTRAIVGCDYVYNFAGIADLDDATTKPITTAQLNILGNINIMEACLKNQVKRFIYASSIYVYSEKGGFYRCSKQASEAYIEEYQRKFNMEYVILRYGTLYGPRADERNSVFRYIKQAIEQKRIIINGTGDEIREYVHVRDAARLSVDILADEYKDKNIIITGHHPMRFNDMLSMIKEILNNGINIQFLGKRDESHYSITPYSYTPRIGHKLVSNYYTDMGQGLLECIDEVYKSC